MFVFSARLATAGAVVAVAAECGIAYPLTDRLPADDAVVIVIVALAVTALGVLMAATTGRGARARPGLRLDLPRAFGRAL